MTSRSGVDQEGSTAGTTDVESESVVRFITEHDTGLGASLYFEFPVATNEPAVDAAYRAMRSRYHFLTDDNHTWTAERRSLMWFALVVRRNERSPEPMGLGGPLPSWVECGPGSYWFTVTFYRGCKADAMRPERAPVLAVDPSWSTPEQAVTNAAASPPEGAP